jgi:hypothetical protein
MVRSKNHSLFGPSHGGVEADEPVIPREPPIPCHFLQGDLGSFIWRQQTQSLFQDVREARASQHTPRELTFPVPFPVCRENRDLLDVDCLHSQFT